MNPPDVAFILVNYFSKNHTLRCLESIAQHTREIRYELLIVDNSAELKAEELTPWPQAQLLTPRHNLGFGAANDRGAERAEAPYLFFLNNDAQLMNDAAAGLFQFMEGHPEAALSGPQLIDGGGQKVCSFDYFPTLASKLLGIGVLRLIQPARFPAKEKLYEAPLEVDLISGASLFVRASVYRQIGGFDQQFFLYCEEEDLALRAREKGYKAYFIPQAVVRHLGGGSSRNPEALKKEFYISFFKFYRKHYGRHRAAVLYLICFEQFLWRSLLRPDKMLWRSLLAWLLRGAPESESLRFAPGNIDAR